MRDPARVQAAIDILDQPATTETPADRGLKGWARANRYAGSKDRRAIEAHVYAAIRQAHFAQWQMGEGTGRALMIASLARDGADLESLFDGSTHAPQPLTEAERAALSKEGAPRHAALNVPAFLMDALEARFGDELEAGLSALNDRAPLDLRVNALKAEPGRAVARLIQEGFSPEPIEGLPHGLRLREGNVSHSNLYKTGLVEIQDAGSQWASLFCGAQPGSQVIDYCAGAGGKALALAALMDNHGQIYAYDNDASRLARLRPRANRAGAHSIQTVEDKDQLPLADLVLVDAPCSGSGAWRRGPETRWRLTPDRLDELQALQAEILREAAGKVGAGGMLVYVTCSILPGENEDQISQFLTDHPEFTLNSATIGAKGETDGRLGGTVQLVPHRHDCDGFFMARLQKQTGSEG